MNIEYLKLFARVATTHNISLAGKELGLSPAVASAHINKLEQHLGIRLIHRTTRKVSLTEDGIAFLPHAEDVLNSVEAARAAVGVSSISPEGKLRIAASATFGHMHLLPIMEEFLDRYQKLNVDLHLSDSMVDMVEGGFDLAIRDARLNDSSLVARKLAPVKRILCASPSYIQKHGEPMEPKQLHNHQCINPIGLDSWDFITDKGKLRVKPNSRFRVDNGEVARDACINGMGITICSTWCCYQQLKNEELVRVLADFPLHSETAIWAVYPSSRMLAPKVRLFIDYLLDCFGDTPYWERNDEEC